jgi:hypothetical protein
MRTLGSRAFASLWLGLAVVLLATSCFLRREPDAPSVEIVSPEDGAVLPSSAFEVRTRVTGVALRPADNTHDPKSGHLHLYIDHPPPASDVAIPAGDPQIFHTTGPTIRVEGLAPGEHTLYVVLGHGDHRPFRPAVRDSVTITVTGEENRLSIVTPRDGATVYGPDVTARLFLGAPGVEVRSADGTREQASGHYHVFVDRAPTPAGEPIPAGQPGIIHSVSPEIALRGLAPGEHTIHAVFGYGDHAPYQPSLAASATFRVTERPPPVVRIISPRNGEAGLPVDVPVRVEVDGIEIGPADGDRQVGRGHLHLIVDRELPPEGEVIPIGVRGVVHTASPETVIPALSPGRHTLSVVLGFGDHSRIPGAETPTITFIVGPAPPPAVTVEPAVVAPREVATIRAVGFAPEEHVSLILFSGEVEVLRAEARADARGEVATAERIPEGTAPDTYILIITGSSGSKSSAALRVIAGEAPGGENWETVARFEGSAAQDTDQFSITREVWRLVWTHRPRGFPAYFFVEARRAAAQNIFDPAISSTRPESGEKLLHGPGSYSLRIISNSDWQIEIQQRMN